MMWRYIETRASGVFTVNRTTLKPVEDNANHEAEILPMLRPSIISCKGENITAYDCILISKVATTSEELYALEIPQKWRDKLNGREVLFDVLFPVSLEEGARLRIQREKLNEIITQRKTEIVNRCDTVILANSLIASIAYDGLWLKVDLNGYTDGFTRVEDETRRGYILNDLIQILDKKLQKERLTTAAQPYLEHLKNTDAAAFDEVNAFIDDVLKEVCTTKHLAKDVRDAIRAYKQKQRNSNRSKAKPAQTGDNNYMPTSQHITQLRTAMQPLKALNKLVSKIKTYNRHWDVGTEFVTDTSKFYLSFVGEKKIGKNTEKITSVIIIDDAIKTTAKADTVFNSFSFLLKAINEQAYDADKKTLYRDYILLDCNKFRTLHGYQRTDNAMATLIEGIDVQRKYDVLTTIETINKKGETEKTEFIKGNFLRGQAVKQGDSTLKVFLETEIMRWDAFFSGFTIMPEHFFKLGNSKNQRYLRLAIALCDQARLAINDIAKKNYFTVTARYMQAIMGLPLETETKNRDRDIKQPIVNADFVLGGIDKGANYSFEMDYSGTKTGDETASTLDILDNARLKVYPQGNALDYFLGLKKLKEVKIQQAKAKAEKKRIALEAAREARREKKSK